jgi:hypothetical protein
MLVCSYSMYLSLSYQALNLYILCCDYVIIQAFINFKQQNTLLQNILSNVNVSIVHVN